MYVLLKLRYLSSDAQSDSGRICTTTRIVIRRLGSLLRFEACWNMLTEKGVIVTNSRVGGLWKSKSSAVSLFVVSLLSCPVVGCSAFFPAIVVAQVIRVFFGEYWPMYIHEK